MYDHDDSDPMYEYEPDYGNRQELLPLPFVRIKAESRKAWLIDFGMDEETLQDVEHWMPKKCCTVETTEKIIRVPEWLVAEKELEDYVE